jgi:hypothetical protein
VDLGVPGEEEAMKDLAKAMGIEWHGYTDDVTPSGNYRMCLCGRAYIIRENHVNPSPTDPAFCWQALQYMMGREDWGLFHFWCVWVKCEKEYWFYERQPHHDARVIKWLLSDPARFIELADDWVREHEEVKP